MEQWCVLSCPGGCYCTGGLPGREPLQQRLGCAAGGGGMLAWLWSCPVLGCVRAACRAVLGGFASSQICSPGGEKTLAAAQSCERKAITSVSSVICVVGQQSPASTAALPCASTTSGKLFNHVDTDLISGPV